MGGQLSSFCARAVAVAAMVFGLALTGCGNARPAACGGGAKACGANADCGGFQCENGCCGTTPVCQSDADCQAGQHCAGGTCTTGSSSSSCGSNADCANVAGATRCDLAGTKTCVECVKASDCGTPAQTCTANKCVAVPSGCASDADCTSDPAGPRCKLTTHTCVPCLGNQDCNLGQVCVGFACISANGSCSDDTACQDPTPHCDTAAGQCVACLDDTQCGGGQSCQNHTCAANSSGCTADSQCHTGAPKCDLTSGQCVACLSTSDCGDPTLVCQANACVAAPSGCQGDGDCSGATPHCDPGSHQCVGCTSTAQCTSPDVCTGNACVAPAAGCTSDLDCASHASTPKCDTASGACVGCLVGGDCASGLCDPTSHACQPGCASSANCAAPTSHCDLTSHSCVACVADGDCAQGQICQGGACQAGCSTKADCAAPTGACDLTSHSCVACVADSDCAANQACTNNACVPTGTSGGQPCGTGGVCPTGQLCLTESGGTTQLCHPQCDPYNPGSTCGTGTVCAWVGFDSSGATAGACVPKSGGDAAGTVCQSASDCENDLLCLPVSATQSKCVAMCDPSGGTCGSGDSCHSLEAYYDATAGNVLSVGACLPSGSTFGEPCYSDFTADGSGGILPDCGTGMTCGPNNLLADPSLRVSTCQYPYGDSQANTACTDGAACVTGDCLGGPQVCDTSCHWTSDCTKRAGLASSYKCMPYPWIGQSPYTGAVNVSDTGACLPTCASDATCAQGTFCMLSPTFENSGLYQSSFYSFCYPQLGDPKGALSKAGQPCSADADCESGQCVTNGKAGATDGYCFGACNQSASATSQCDPAHGTTCDPNGIGLQLNDGADGVQGTSDDQYGRAYVCSGIDCTSDADCAGFAASGAGARTCRLTLVVNGANTAYGATESARATCEPRVGNSKAGAPCTSNAGCQSGWCFQWDPNDASTKYCMGACATDSDCSSAGPTTCQAKDFSAAKDGSDVISACAP